MSIMGTKNMMMFEKIKLTIINPLIFMGVFLMMVSKTNANEFAVNIGIRSDSAKSTSSGVSIGSKTNFQLGALGLLELDTAIFIRAGFAYVKRSYLIDSTAQGSGDFAFTNFDIPLGILFKFTDYAGAFAGGLVSLNSGSECSLGSNCKPVDVNPSPMGFQLGVHFKFAPQMGGELYYEALQGKLASGIESASAIVGNLIITFD